MAQNEKPILTGGFKKKSGTWDMFRIWTSKNSAQNQLQPAVQQIRVYYRRQINELQREIQSLQKQIERQVHIFILNIFLYFCFCFCL